MEPFKFNQPFSIRKRIASFGYALKGIKVLLIEEHNARIHLVATVLVVTLGFFFHISLTEWFFVMIAIALVFITELINSAIERLVDEFSHEIKPQLGVIKDMAAASVLVAALLSVGIGLVIFIPYIFGLL